MNPTLRSSSDIAMDDFDKRSSKTLYGEDRFYDGSSYLEREEEPDPIKSEEERALVRKIDWLIMPIICTIDFIQFIDKSSINYAAIFSFKSDLNLVGDQYSLLGSIFYLGYLLFQLPNNFILQMVPIGRYMGVIVTLWGVVLVCTAFGTNFSQMAALRFLLGLLEAGIYPSLTLLISTFYRRSEQAARLGIFWLCNGFSLIFGGLVTYGIGRMTNTYGLKTWQWIMIILGSCTVVVGVVTFFFLIDNPKSKVLKLNAEQEILIEERTRDNAVVRTTSANRAQIMEALKEPRLWCLCFACLLVNLQNGAMTIYNGQLTQTFGFNQLQSVLLSIGTGGSDIILIMGAVWVVQRTKQTIYTACGLMVIDIIGLILLVVIPVPKAKLVGFYLAWSYCAAYVLLVTTIANNVSGYTKKIFYNGLLMVFYTVGNFVGPLMMVESQKPTYIGGMIGYIVANTIVIVLLLIARWRMAIVNKQRLSKPSEYVTNVEDDLTDVQDPNFIYRL